MSVKSSCILHPSHINGEGKTNVGHFGKEAKQNNQINAIDMTIVQIHVIVFNYWLINHSNLIYTSTQGTMSSSPFAWQNILTEQALLHTEW